MVNLESLISGSVDKADLDFTQWVTSVMPTTGQGGVPNPRTSPVSMLKYLDGRRQTIIEGARLRPLIRIADKNLDGMFELEGEVDCSVEELLNDTGKVTIKILYDNWVADWMIHQTKLVEDLHILIDPDPTDPHNWRTRWGGKIVEIHVKQDQKGIHTIELTALSHREHAKRLLVAANPIFAPEIQLPRMWVLPGPCRTILSLTMFVNLARIFMPGLSTVANAFNPFSWLNPFNAGALGNLLPTNWPIQVAFVNMALDQSRFTTIGATWTDWHSTFKDILLDAGCVLRAYTFLTTDKDSPNGELADILRAAPDLVGGLLDADMTDFDNFVDNAVRPQRNCVVFAVEQKDGRTGPTGTIADSFVSLVAVTLDDLISPFLVDVTNGRIIDAGQVLNGQSVEDATGLDRTYLIEKLTLTAPEPPKVIWWEGEFSGAINTDLIFHKSSAKTTMTGGKSPTIVNEAQTFGIRFGLSQIQTVITGGIFAQTGGPPIGVGLSDIYQGQLDNTLLAWQRFTNPIRALYSGDLSWQEHFEKGTGTAYTLATTLTLRAGDFKTRPFASFKASVLNGRPWIVDKDYVLGDRVGFERDGIIYVDQVYSVKRQWSRSEYIKVTVGIGEDRMKADPFGAAFKTIGALWGAVGQTLGGGALFG